MGTYKTSVLNPIKAWLNGVAEEESQFKMIIQITSSRSPSRDEEDAALRNYDIDIRGIQNTSRADLVLEQLDADFGGGACEIMQLRLRDKDDRSWDAVTSKFCELLYASTWEYIAQQYKEARQLQEDRLEWFLIMENVISLLASVKIYSYCTSLYQRIWETLSSSMSLNMAYGGSYILPNFFATGCGRVLGTVSVYDLFDPIHSKQFLSSIKRDIKKKSVETADLYYYICFNRICVALCSESSDALFTALQDFLSSIRAKFSHRWLVCFASNVLKAVSNKLKQQHRQATILLNTLKNWEATYLIDQGEYLGPFSFAAFFVDHCIHNKNIFFRKQESARWECRSMALDSSPNFWDYEKQASILPNLGRYRGKWGLATLCTDLISPSSQRSCQMSSLKTIKNFITTISHCYDEIKLARSPPWSFKYDERLGRFKFCLGGFRAFHVCQIKVKVTGAMDIDFFGTQASSNKDFDTWILSSETSVLPGTFHVCGYKIFLPLNMCITHEIPKPKEFILCRFDFLQDLCVTAEWNSLSPKSQSIIILKFKSRNRKNNGPYTLTIQATTRLKHMDSPNFTKTLSLQFSEFGPEEKSLMVELEEFLHKVTILISIQSEWEIVERNVTLSSPFQLEKMPVKNLGSISSCEVILNVNSRSPIVLYSSVSDLAFLEEDSYALLHYVPWKITQSNTCEWIELRSNFGSVRLLNKVKDQCPANTIRTFLFAGDLASFPGYLNCYPEIRDVSIGEKDFLRFDESKFWMILGKERVKLSTWNGAFLRIATIPLVRGISAVPRLIKEGSFQTRFLFIDGYYSCNPQVSTSYPSQGVFLW